ncbi:MAG: endonuclease domain-containing protein [Acetobacteraceae bacterium]|nr:endonuclease domain-containing protein [Acetobacteraceae bacterium]
MTASKVAPRTLPTAQRERARTMRNAPTPAEQALWQQLRGSKLAGHKFSRQIAIGPFIADLVCRREKLVIELDGSQHDHDADARRTRFLEGQGYTVLRFTNMQVRDDIDMAVRVIAARLASVATPPPPTPPASGRGDALATTGLTTGRGE